MSSVAAKRATAPFAPMLAKQSWAEFIKLFRVPAFSTTSIVLPAMFYAFIGLGQAKQPLANGLTVTFGEYFLASMALYGVANVMVLGFGISLANERGQKQDLLMQSTPLPALVFFIAKTISALVIAFMALVVLSLLAYAAGGAHLTSSQWLTLFLRAMLCSIPFVGLGFALGYLAGPNSAPAVTNLIYLPTAFASGLFFPLHLLPQFLQNIAPYLPLYRGAQLVWDSVGAPTEGGSLSTDWLYMGGFTVAFFVLAIWAYRRDQGRKFN
ncbi:MAG TPA: ABC transporter permease [Candidatus Sulfotelmatobacter sp.]|nr:ABC transporter permease [Candidatus Sulfotelmatobacter sp.]